MIDAKHLAAALAVASLSLASVAAAAGPEEPDRTVVAPSAAHQSGSSGAPEVTWLASAGFHLSAERFHSSDPRFNWDAHFGGNVDVVDYGAGRLNVLADYEVVVGSERRAVDPNQSAYRLEISASWRTHGVDLQGIFHHVSRHLSDREFDRAVSWNGAGAAAASRYARGPFAAAVNVYGLRIVQAAYVDYTWRLGTQLDGEYRFSPRVGVRVRAHLLTTFVDPKIAGRGTQTTARFESAVRLRGKGAAVELFAAWERRLDPYPLDYSTATWTSIGFRFVSR